jgi:ferredoxin
MKTTIYYYSGTGNSLWTARELSTALGGAELLSMSGTKKTGIKAEAVGFVFPVHMWGVPGVVLDFIKKLEKNPDTYYFAAAVNAGQVSRTLIQLDKFMEALKIKLSAGISIVLPSNYIPWGGPGSENAIKKEITKAREKISGAAAYIGKKQTKPVDKGPLWQRIIFTKIYNMTIKYIAKMDRSFKADDKCNSCGICVKVCPSRNIEMSSGKPVWNHNCQQCFSCIQWCPQSAIQFGKTTEKYKRYHHPSVNLNDMYESLK